MQLPFVFYGDKGWYIIDQRLVAEHTLNAVLKTGTVSKAKLE
jgi:hypothetical protein